LRINLFVVTTQFKKNLDRGNMHAELLMYSLTCQQRIPFNSNFNVKILARWHNSY